MRRNALCGRELRIESLENRQLLAVSPLALAGVVSYGDGGYESAYVSSPAYSQTALFSPYRPSQATAVTEHVPDQTVTEGSTAVAAKELLIANTSFASLQGVKYKVYGPDGCSVPSARLMADMDLNGSFETLVCRDGNGDRVLSFTDPHPGFRFGRGLRIPASGALPLQVEFDVSADDAPGEYKLSEPSWSLTQSYYRRILVGNVGYANPTIAIETAQPELYVVARSMASQDTVVENQKQVPVFHWTAEASNGAELFATEFTFSGKGLVNGEVYDAWADLDGDKKPETLVMNDIVAQGNRLSVDELVGGGIAITDTTMFCLTADIGGSVPEAPYNTLQVTGPTSVEAEVLSNGAPLHDDQIIVVPGKGTQVEIVEHGTLDVCQDPTPIRPQYVLAGESSTILVSAEFSANVEVADIVYVGVNIEGNVDAINRVLLSVQGEVIAMATRNSAKPGDDFGLHMQSQQLVIPVGERADLDFSVQTRSDEEGAQPGDFSVHMSTVEARGFTSSNSYPVITSNVVSPVHTIVLAKADDAYSVHPDADGCAIPMGSAVVNMTRIDAAMNENTFMGRNDLELLVFEYTVTPSNWRFDPTSFSLSNLIDPMERMSPTSVTYLNGNPVTTLEEHQPVRVRFEGVREQIFADIGSGDSEAFAFEMENLGKVSGGSQSSLQVDFDSFAAVFSDGVETFTGLRLAKDAVTGPHYRS